MKTTPAPTLSEHLLREASKFLLYPNRRRRTSLGFQKDVDSMLRNLAEWRKTFAPRPLDKGSEILSKPVWLDELYCRDLLRDVPAMVGRTRNLSQLTLAEVTDTDSFIYLREAANCYILGLPQAAIALARAAVEARLRAAASKVFGKSAAADLIDAINDFANRGRLLTREVQALGHKVRVAANDVLHGRQLADSTTALSILEAVEQLPSFCYPA